MEKQALKANIRTEISKSSRSNLRRSGKVPGVFYSRVNKPIPIEVSEKAIKPFVFTAKTHLISLEVENDKNYDCVVKDVQFDPVTESIVHFDLLGLIEGEKFQLEVPIQYHGTAIGIKEGGIVQQVLHKLEIECYPKDIPQFLSIDITNLKLGESIHPTDLTFKNISILTTPETVVVAVVHPKVEKEPVAAEVTAEALAEPEVIGKGKATEEEEEKE
ncbi:MAG: 50S ribosomal protein L25 [Ignavibacteria bacterium RIFOXYB2_FULL_35_12]|nr:MAG: 50S ribosomal protein L25 [Ignavibacteria bacterium GWA2_36_19]OGU57439.1 MAG: 50S ribosomal protein L25 [Ignavibacteria bacterium GWF2_35_20]OGU76811.1 MAG: 50S ribosomal protein L25 [Ignavibacteria bacterium RBG_16_35_7]OGU88376.1 MAG: 50S ribosomal protein L25 [Ignavibacteria bacterium RIFOXYC12_FULL_35_11]OGU91553.1 MAG: 50S ribosomal protein L25 [Ignavibacteria bacterium RIFOXYA12_FULL_35_25]OGU97903.1 MAG: 50S ribosomal protein L25 [Ignavibacteria bacterium RIFOXYB12_FULL_35_14]